MTNKNTIIISILLLIFAFAIVSLVYPVLGREEIQLGLDLQGGLRLVYQADLSAVAPGDEGEVMDGVIAVIANRINPLGVTEPNIERRGKDQIVVELPEASVTDIQKERIGRTALLEFRELIIDDEGNQEWVAATATVNGQEKTLNSSYFKENTSISQGNLGEIILHCGGKPGCQRVSGNLQARQCGVRAEDYRHGNGIQNFIAVVIHGKETGVENPGVRIYPARCHGGVGGDGGHGVFPFPVTVKVPGNGL